MEIAGSCIDPLLLHPPASRGPASRVHCFSFISDSSIARHSRHFLSSVDVDDQRHSAKSNRFSIQSTFRDATGWVPFCFQEFRPPPSFWPYFLVTLTSPLPSRGGNRCNSWGKFQLSCLNWSEAEKVATGGTLRLLDKHTDTFDDCYWVRMGEVGEEEGARWWMVAIRSRNSSRNILSFLCSDVASWRNSRSVANKEIRNGNLSVGHV